MTFFFMKATPELQASKMSLLPHFAQSFTSTHTDTHRYWVDDLHHNTLSITITITGQSRHGAFACTGPFQFLKSIQLLELLAYYNGPSSRCMDANNFFGTAVFVYDKTDPHCIVGDISSDLYRPQSQDEIVEFSFFVALSYESNLQLGCF